MKSYICAFLVFAVLLVTIPAVPVIIGKADNSQLSKSDLSQSETDTTEEKSEKKTSEYTEYKTLKVLDITTGKVEEVSAFDYVVGAVSAEMPATFEHEALKAQAVAAYTYAIRQAKKAELAPDSELNGAYFSNDSSKYQAYFTENQIMQYYGDNYQEYMAKIVSAVSEVKGEYIAFEDEPIIAAYHSLSSGYTESAENVWGGDISYLTSVKSEYDTKSPNFLESYEFTDNEMKELLEKSFDDIKLSDNPEEWFSDFETSDADTVITVKVGNKKLTGQQIRSALTLRSAAFEVKYDNGFKISSKGCGHGVGMSQYGANEMAKSGKNYEEILLHYYKGVEIKK